ncbi:capsule biosynthesis protein [Sphingomonas mucosissima]|uniref:Capsule polysaccharide biosynthesis protein n=1 Tax=Sphingomonas mucosissima TaxID=370959 RepID=A0A245ZT49_9SPHN|nr:capsular biosynthesis protein [Sphingomonas mucosissima]OWK32933.1 capsule polysaccharide biosynthesis protein [Sphingomonas mucosissima]
MTVGERRRFLFLQGPHGSYFARLGGALSALGHHVFRINLCGGDRLDWPEPAVDFRGTLQNWPVFFDDFIVDHDITDVVLFGDCRPHHSSAHGMAKIRGLRVHVLEEGYIRPDYVTLEEGGVNGHSRMPRDPTWFRAEASRLPPEPERDPVPSSFRRRAKETIRHLAATMLLAPAYPFYRTHRPNHPLVEAAGWGLWSATQTRERRLSQRTLDKIIPEREDHPIFLAPLQLNSDYQLRVHSPFDDMRAALRFIVKSFARTAPAHSRLLVKRHPLDNGLVPWRKITRKLARRYGVEDRIFYISHGDIAKLLPIMTGAVMVNSTVGTLALNEGVPVAVLGHAVYDVAGVVHRGALDDFWPAPAAPDAALWAAVRRVFVNRSLVHGGFLSEEGLAMLVENAIPRLTAPAARPATAGNVTRIAHWR